MKLFLEEYDPQDEVHKQMLLNNLPFVEEPSRLKLRVFLLKQTGEYVILDFQHSPEVVWIEYMYIFKSYKIFYPLVEELLKALRIHSVRYMITPKNIPPMKQCKRIINILLENKFKFLDMDISNKESFTCYEKFLSKRYTGSSTMFEIKEESE